MRKFCDWNSDRYRVQPGASWRRTTGSAQVSCGPRPSLRSESQLTKLGVCGPPRRTHTLHYSAKYFIVDLHSCMHSTSMTMLACPSVLVLATLVCLTTLVRVEDNYVCDPISESDRFHVSVIGALISAISGATTFLSLYM